MSAPPPQLPNSSAPYLPNAIPKYPRQPHLWQQMLATFGGEMGKNAIDSSMAPRATTDAAGNTTFNKGGPFWRQAPSAAQTIDLNRANALNKLTGSETGKNIATTQTENVLRDPQVQQLLAQGGFTKANTAHVSGMLPLEQALMGAQTGETEQRGRLTGQQADWVAPQALGNLRELGSRANYTDALSDWVGPQAQAAMGREAAQTSLLGSQGQLTQQEAEKNKLYNIMMSQNPQMQEWLKNSGVNSPLPNGKTPGYVPPPGALFQQWMQQGQNPSSMMPNPAWANTSQ